MVVGTSNQSINQSIRSMNTRSVATRTRVAVIETKDKRTMTTTVNDLPYDCLDRILAVADETQELKAEVASLKARNQLLVKNNIRLTAREKHIREYIAETAAGLKANETHLMECNTSLKARNQLLIERNARLKAKEEHTMDCNAKLKARELYLMDYNDKLKAREKLLVECNASMEASVVMERNIILKARETHLLKCNAGLKDNETILFECNTSLKARETDLMDKNRALEDKLTKMTPAPAPCAAPRPRRSGRLWARRLASE